MVQNTFDISEIIINIFSENKVIEYASLLKKIFI